MICFNPMDTWNRQQMPGCTHSICITCADRMQSTLYDSDDTYETYDLSDDMSDSSEISIDDDHLSYGHSPVPHSEIPIDYTVKVSLEGYKITRVNYYELEGIYDIMPCPYCRQHGPIWYNFDEIRYCIPSHISEWNMLERKLTKDKLTYYTMKREGATFAFKLSHDRKVLRIMWTEVNQYGFGSQPHHSDKTYAEPILTKYPKDSRAYSRKRTFTKMVR